MSDCQEQETVVMESPAIENSATENSATETVAIDTTLLTNNDFNLSPECRTTASVFEHWKSCMNKTDFNYLILTIDDIKHNCIKHGDIINLSSNYIYAGSHADVLITEIIAYLGHSKIGKINASAIDSFLGKDCKVIQRCALLTLDKVSTEQLNTIYNLSRIGMIFIINMKSHYDIPMKIQSNTQNLYIKDLPTNYKLIRDKLVADFQAKILTNANEFIRLFTAYTDRI